MKTRGDLLALINLLKKEDLNEQFQPYTMKQLGYFCNPNHVFHRYRQFHIPKKSGAKRLITAPFSKSYMYMLRYVNHILQSIHEASKHTMGFVPGRCIVDNATVHVGMNYVFNIDLKDFFPSIERKRIVSRLQHKPFNMTEEVALTIAGLCCMRTEEVIEGKTIYKYVLPQGSPASPTLTNIVCDKLDFILSGLAKRFGVNYTRYADDISFSSKHNVYQNNSEFRKELTRIIEEQGFTINEKKTRLNKLGSRQEVTGLTVSQDKVNVTRLYAKELRNILYIWDKYGYGFAEFQLHDYNMRHHPEKNYGVNLINVVSGKLMFMKMVKGADDSTFQKLNKKYIQLMTRMSKLQPKSTRADKVLYLETMPVPAFELRWETELIISSEKDNNSENKRHVDLLPWPVGYAFGVSLLRTTPIDTPKDKLYISLCRHKNQRPFYLVHEEYKSPRIKEKVDLDKLLTDIESLLQ